MNTNWITIQLSSAFAFYAKVNIFFTYANTLRPASSTVIVF